MLRQKYQRYFSFMNDDSTWGVSIVLPVHQERDSGSVEPGNDWGIYTWDDVRVAPREHGT